MASSTEVIQVAAVETFVARGMSSKMADNAIGMRIKMIGVFIPFVTRLA